jgi:hypothetical protein
MPHGALLMNRLLILITLLLIAPLSHAQDKPALVLMPITAVNTDFATKEQYRNAVQRGLSDRYKVFSGAVVEQKLEKSAAKTCNDTECLQQVAIEFQGELIAYVIVNPQEGGALLSLEIKNIFQDAIIESESVTCRDCNSLDIADRLIQLASSRQAIAAPAPIAQPDEGWSMPWWGWVGAAVIIGAVAAGGGGGGGDSAATTPTAPTNNGNVSASWKRSVNYNVRNPYKPRSRQC